MTLALLSRAAPAALLTLMLWPAAVQSQGTDVRLNSVDQESRDAPVEVISNQLEVDQLAGTALFTGDVVVTQGEIRINAPEMLVQYIMLPDGSVSSEVDTITANGGVLMVTPTEEAESDDAVYTPARDEVVMTGNVLLTQGPNTVNGTRLTVDVTTGEGRMEGRVRTVLQPGSDSE
ncbi:MAG: lipopolysaccharide transport periplasmic protein LptA [Mangrovicoccus sp.]|nr:lipopolysaccharide transport periplasmic protein LptA [Mangrovicoccus sp.]